MRCDRVCAHCFGSPCTRDPDSGMWECAECIAGGSVTPAEYERRIKIIADSCAAPVTDWPTRLCVEVWSKCEGLEGVFLTLEAAEGYVRELREKLGVNAAVRVRT